MSPRLGPKSYGEHVDEQERIRAAAREFAADKEASLERVSRKHGITSVREPSPYGSGSEHSYFLDLAYAVADIPSPPPPIVGDVAAARKRLQSVAERRDLTTTVTAGGNFVPTGTPAYVGEKFAAAARAAATMATVLPFEPLPETGMTVKAPRITSGTSTAVMASENSSVSETDIVESMISSPVATVAGQQDVSQQLFDRSDPAIVDIVLATDLGRSLGAALDQQVFAGTGAQRADVRPPRRHWHHRQRVHGRVPHTGGVLACPGEDRRRCRDGTRRTGERDRHAPAAVRLGDELEGLSDRHAVEHSMARAAGRAGSRNPHRGRGARE
jgi:hypothetical protein